MYYYQFNIGDYASHTLHLDPLEDIAYRRMLDYCYLNEIGLPESTEEIGRLIRMRTHCDCIANVLREFFYLEEDTWRNQRAEKDISAFRTKSQKAAKSARKRWENTDANAMPTQCKGNANQEPITKNHKPRTNNKDTAASAPDVIDVFGYWKQVMGKSDSSKLTPKRDKAIKAVLKLGYTVDQIKQAIRGCKNSPFHQGQNDRHTVFDDIELICRSGEKLESFASCVGAGAGVETITQFQDRIGEQAARVAAFIQDQPDD